MDGEGVRHSTPLIQKKKIPHFNLITTFTFQVNKLDNWNLFFEKVFVQIIHKHNM